jgi:glycosyltransferase involved in cell wall biosynthesis
LSITSRHRPAVSVVIPCFNAERLVGDAIRSALAQTYPETEIIVIDDGSIDGSRGVIESFADRVRWVVEPHRGGGAARNRGLELARGEFVQFLDADDVLDAECLARKVAMQQEYPDVCICCDWRRIDLSGQVAREEPGVDRLAAAQSQRFAESGWFRCELALLSGNGSTFASRLPGCALPASPGGPVDGTKPAWQREFRLHEAAAATRGDLHSGRGDSASA